MNTVHKFPVATDATLIAVVTKVEKGQALTIRPLSGEDAPVAAHGSMVPVLNVDDQVLVINSADGYVVLDRLRGEGEEPFMANHNGQLIFESQKFVGLKVQDCYLRMDKKGELMVHAKNIRSLAEAINEIQGELVKLN